MSRSLPIVALLVVVLSGLARGQEPAEMDPGQVHYQRGAGLHDLGRYDLALREFNRAYQSKPDPVLLINIGRCHFQLGDPRQALVFYRRYLQEEPHPDPATRGKVEQRIAEAEQALPAQPEVKPATAAPPPLPPPPVLTRPPRPGKRKALLASGAVILSLGCLSIVAGGLTYGLTNFRESGAIIGGVVGLGVGAVTGVTLLGIGAATHE